MKLLLAAACVLALAGGVVDAASARDTGQPFYLVPPSPRQECHNVKDCVSVIGPWVVVPAKGEATFLLLCPKNQGYVGGTDSRASSPAVHVWFDGQIGAPISQSITTSYKLLFHAVAKNARVGVFQPVLGCITLQKHSNGRSTVSARATVPGTSTGSLDYQMRLVVLNAGTNQSATVACPAPEKIVGSWSSLAFVSIDPPSVAHAGAVKTTTRIVGNAVQGSIATALSLPFAPLAEVQIGAVCAR
ncbi:MAG: hypothetical protein JO017_11800 [Actinobacteria bacterium]|nr:hypothetical protein [Actinomycetota bacterium]